MFRGKHKEETSKNMKHKEKGLNNLLQQKKNKAEHKHHYKGS